MLCGFKGGKTKCVTYINDSKITPEATWLIKSSYAKWKGHLGYQQYLREI